MTMPPSHSSPLQPSRGEDTIQTTRDDRSSGAEDSYRADALQRLHARSNQLRLNLDAEQRRSRTGAHNECDLALGVQSEAGKIDVRIDLSTGIGSSDPDL
jgi:hypothetical protein